MKYKIKKELTKLEVLVCIKRDFPDSDFVASDIAHILEVAPSSLSIFIRSLIDDEYIEVLGSTLIKDQAGNLQKKTVYKLV